MALEFGANCTRSVCVRLLAVGVKVVEVVDVVEVVEDVVVETIDEVVVAPPHANCHAS